MFISTYNIMHSFSWLDKVCGFAPPALPPDASSAFSSNSRCRFGRSFFIGSCGSIGTAANFSGALKGLYDVLLLLMFKAVRPPEEADRAGRPR